MLSGVPYVIVCLLLLSVEGNLLGGMAIIVVFGSIFFGVMIFTCAFLWIRFVDCLKYMILTTQRSRGRRVAATPAPLFPYQFGEGVTTKVSELSRAASLKTVLPSSVKHSFPSRYY